MNLCIITCFCRSICLCVFSLTPPVPSLAVDLIPSIRFFLRRSLHGLYEVFILPLRHSLPDPSFSLSVCLIVSHFFILSSTTPSSPKLLCIAWHGILAFPHPRFCHFLHVSFAISLSYPSSSFCIIRPITVTATIPEFLSKCRSPLPHCSR